MKIHTFRMKRVEGVPENIDDELDKKYPLYAFTREEKIATRFMEERNQSNFVYIPIKKDEDCAEEWCIAHRAKQLGKYSLETFINKNLDTQDVRYVEIVGTEGEVDFLMESIDTFSIIHRFCHYISPDIFTEKIYNVLKYLGYVDMARFNASMTITEYPSGIVAEPNTEEDDLDFLGSIPVRFDQFGCWNVLYGDMFTERFYKNIVYMKYPKKHYESEPPFR